MNKLKTLILSIPFIKHEILKNKMLSPVASVNTRIIILEAALSSISSKYQISLDSIIEKDSIIRMLRSEVSDCNTLMERLDNEIGQLKNKLNQKSNAKHKRNTAAIKRTKKRSTKAKSTSISAAGK